MAKIHSIKIQHYRGIESFEQVFGDNNFIVLIGRGDSGKSTILKAIYCVLSPAWNLTFSDADFHNCDISTPIIIEVTLRDVPKELWRDDKFGLYYRLLKGKEVVDNVSDEGADQSTSVLTIQLKVDETLEPKWYVITGREGQEPKEISGKDRALFSMFYVADYADSHFAYNRQSPLFSLLRQEIEDPQEVTRKIQNAVRQSYKTIAEDPSFGNFAISTDKIKEEAKKLGLAVEDLTTSLEYKDNAYTESNISLHSNNVPYRLHGKGTKRLMSMAIQLALADQMGILLIDEIEQGLEPDRVRNIVRVLKKENKGQIFITTHANGTILEAGAKSIYLMQSNANHLQTFSEELQGGLRHHPEAYFAKACIFCEGATEYGMIRSLDSAIMKEKGYGLATMGISVVDSGGSSHFYEYAMEMQKCGYDVITFNDDDNADIKKIKQKAIDENVKIVTCEEGKCIEQQIFKDVPWDCVVKIAGLAVKNNHEQSVLAVTSVADITQLQSISSEKYEEVRVKMGNAAHNGHHAWYKNVSAGEELGNLILQYEAELNPDCQLYKEISALRSWILSYAID